MKRYPRFTLCNRFAGLLAILVVSGCVSSAPPRLDLHDVDRYTAAGRSLMRDGQFSEAVELLQEGIHHNPHAFQLLSVLLGTKFGDPGEATTTGRRYLQEVGPDPVIERNLPAAVD